MRLQFLLFSVLILTITSCGKYSKKNIETDLGYVNEKDDEINYLPYLTTSQRLIDAIEVDSKFELEVYKEDKTTISTTVETGYFLALKKQNGTIVKWYRLSKKPLYGQLTVNSPNEFGVAVNLPFLDIRSTQPSPQTVYFDAEKDSTYTVFLDSSDSAAGIAFCSILDGSGNVYYSDVVSRQGAGGGVDSTSAYTYSFTALETGRIYLECYGIMPNPTEDKVLAADIFIWVQN